MSNDAVQFGYQLQRQRETADPCVPDGMLDAVNIAGDHILAQEGQGLILAEFLKAKLEDNAVPKPISVSFCRTVGVVTEEFLVGAFRGLHATFDSEWLAQSIKIHGLKESSARIYRDIIQQGLSMYGVKGVIPTQPVEKKKAKKPQKEDK